MLASLAGQASVFVSGPANARLLGPTGRGELALMGIVTMFGVTFGGAGIPNAIAFAAARRRIPARSVLRSVGAVWLSLTVLTSSLAALAVVLLYKARLASNPWLEAPLVVVWVVSAMLLAVLMGCLQGEHRFRLYNSLRTINAAAAAVITLALFLALHHAGVAVVLGGLVGANVVACLAVWTVCAKVLDPQNPNAAPPSPRFLVGYGLRAVAGANAPVESLSIDQALVGLLLSRQELGYYVVGGAFNNLPSLLVLGLGAVALPTIAAEADAGARARTIRRAMVLTVAIAASAAAGTELIVGIVLPAVFGVAFASALPVARLLIIAGFLLAVRRMLVVFLQATGHPGHTTISELAAVAVLAVLAVALIPRLGILGAGFSLIGAALSANLYLIFALRAHARDDHRVRLDPEASDSVMPV